MQTKGTSGLISIVSHWHLLLGGLGVTVEISILSFAIALAIGIPLGIARAVGNGATVRLVGVYVDVMRALPLLVVLLYAYFALPLLVHSEIGSIPAAIGGLAVWWGAVVTEAVRAGVESVRPGQSLAGLALGMTRVQTLRRIVLPQAIVRMIPVLASTFVTVILSSALASAIAAPELLQQSDIVSTETYQPFPVLTLALIVYLVIAYPVGWLGSFIYEKLKDRGVG